MAWRPSGYDDDTNEWMNQRYQKTGKLPSAVETWDYIGHAAIEKQKEASFAEFATQAGINVKDNPEGAQAQPAAARGSATAGQTDTSGPAAYAPDVVAFYNPYDNMVKNGTTGNSQDTATPPFDSRKAPGISSGGSAPSDAVLYPNTTLNATPPDDGFNPLDWNDWKKLAGDVGNRIKSGVYGAASGLVGDAVNNLLGADNHINIVIDGDRISVMDTGNAGYDPSDGKVREKVPTDGGYTFVESAATEEQLAQILGYGSVKEMKLALINQRNFVDFVNRGNAYSDQVRNNIAAQYQDTHDKAAKVTGFAGSLLPGYGDARDVLETVKGQDLSTGETLPLWQRGLTGAAMMLPFVSGATIRSSINGAEELTEGVVKYGDEAADAGEALLKRTNELDDAAKGAGDKLSGPVEITPPSNATHEQIAQTKAYIDWSNQALQAGKLSPTGRVSTVGSLRIRANASAVAERARAAAAGSSYQGHVGHVPDATWTGAADPFTWLDLDPSVNMSLGGQATRYPIGYKPTEFRFKDR